MSVLGKRLVRLEGRSPPAECLTWESVILDQLNNPEAAERRIAELEAKGVHVIVNRIVDVAGRVTA